MMGVAIGPSDSTEPGNAAQTVNGNYGFATSKINLYAPGNAKNPAPNHDLPLYADLAETDTARRTCRRWTTSSPSTSPRTRSDGKPMYKVTTEADVNVFDGDTYLPQENYPPATPAAANDPAGPPDATPLPPSQPPSQQAGIISPCVGPLHTINVTDPRRSTPVVAARSRAISSRTARDKLVTVRTGQATAPNFNLFTDVPIPTHFWGLTLNDLGLTLDKRSVNYGEAQGLPFVPVGLYDWSGRLVDTMHTDFNGLYEGLEPSTDTYNCPVPAGPCPNMYRFVGNDPGQPGALNPDYNSRFRTIATNFQGWPGLYTVTDEAPTQVATTALAPGHHGRQPDRLRSRPDTLRRCSPSTGRTYARAPRRTHRVVTDQADSASARRSARCKLGTPNRALAFELDGHQDRVHGAGGHSTSGPAAMQHHPNGPARRASTG